MSPFFVRTAGERDLAVVSRLLGETWHATYDGIYGGTRVSEITASWHAVEALRPRLKRPNSEFLVADDGSRIGGMAFAGASGEDAKLVVLHQLYVLPDCQGQGIGTTLLEEIAECFPDARRIRVEVEDANLRAIAFFRRRGFEPLDLKGERGAEPFPVPASVYERPL